MRKFIYVFSEEACSALVAEGYTLLKSDKKNNMFVFENKSELHFAIDDIEYLFSDTLTF